jgi:hypothetical protein
MTNRGTLRTAASAAAATTALLVAACAGGQVAAARTPVQQALAYAQCMRSNGEPGFPEPDNDGLFQNLGPVDVHSRKYLSASKACGHLLPAYQAGPEQQRQTLSRQLRYAACLRSHGFPDTPDPVTVPGGIEGAGPGGAAGPGNQADTDSPRYSAARHACLPFLTGART